MTLKRKQAVAATVAMVLAILGVSAFRQDPVIEQKRSAVKVSAKENVRPVTLDDSISAVGVPATLGHSFASLPSLSSIDLIPTPFQQHRALYELASNASWQKTITLLDEVDDGFAESLAHNARHILISRLVDLDAVAAASWVLTRVPASPYLSEWLGQAARVDLDGIVELFVASQSTHRRRLLWLAMIGSSKNYYPNLAKQWLPLVKSDEEQLLVDLFSKIGQNYPDVVADYVGEVKSRNERLNLLRLLAEAWGQQDIQAGRAFSLNLGLGEERQVFVQALYESMAEFDPEGALTATEKESVDLRQRVVGKAMRKLGQDDPRRGLQIAAAIEHSGIRHQARGGLFESWTQTAPRDAIAELQHLTNISNRVRSQWSEAAIYSMAQSNPDEALMWVERISGGSTSVDDSSSLLGIVVSVLADRDMDSAWSVVEAQDNELTQLALSEQLIGHLSMKDPFAAIARAEKLPASSARNNIMANIVRSWAQYDPASAIAWMLDLPVENRQSAVNDMGWRLASMDLELAVEAAMQLSSAELERWIPAVLNQFNATDPHQATQWLRKFEDDPNYSLWIGIQATALVRSDSRKALALLDTIQEDESYPAMQRDVVQQWSYANPLAAAKWWHRLPDSERHRETLAALVSNWAGRDERSATKWALRMAVPQERDWALAPIVMFNNSDPTRAHKLLMQISSQHIRADASYQLFHWLANRDVGRAEQWLRSLRLHPDRELQLLNQLPSTRL